MKNIHQNHYGTLKALRTSALYAAPNLVFGALGSATFLMGPNPAPPMAAIGGLFTLLAGALVGIATYAPQKGREQHAANSQKISASNLSA
jgi:hypothetical protein